MAGSRISYCRLTCGVLLLASLGCVGSTGVRKVSFSDPQDRVRQIKCVFTTNSMWFSVDPEGDVNPEGLKFLIFLRTAGGESVLRDGTLSIFMYRIDRGKEGEIVRKLVGEWTYPTDALNTIRKPGLLGPGYAPQIYWDFHKYQLPGAEIDVFVRYEDPFGDLVQSASKRLRIPRRDR